MRWFSMTTGAVLIAVAFAAATRVADTRAGLIAEVITLLGGLVGIGFFLYGLLSRTRPAVPVSHVQSAGAVAMRPARELAIGTGGLLIAALLLSGLAMSAGWQWAILGLVLLLPMIAGSVYLCARFLRAH